MKYRRKPVVIDAMQAPSTRDQDGFRRLAEWMVDQGYEVEGLGVEQVDAMYVYGEHVLPEYGSNYLEFESEDVFDRTVRCSDYVVHSGGQFNIWKASLFEAAHDEVPA